MRRTLRNRSGTTLVEMLVTLTLITMMMGMATATLASASRIFLRTQKLQYAQAVLDTTLTELRSQTINATGYVKIYSDGTNLAEQQGVSSGQALEFQNEEGYTVVLAAQGNGAVNQFVGDQQVGTVDAIPSGRLYARYYQQSNDEYIYSRGTSECVRAMAEIFPKKYYIGNYLKVTFSFLDGTQAGDDVTAIKAEAALYSDEACTEQVAADSEILDFRYKLQRKDAVTAESSL